MSQAKKPKAAVKVKFEPIFQAQTQAEAQMRFKLLHTILYDYSSYDEKDPKFVFLRSLRNMAAVAAGEPTTEEDEE